MSRGREHSSPSIALALGAGGARGLAHVPMLEALDELGVRPVCIAGTSVGAIFGAAYACGMSAGEIHDVTVATLRDRRGMVSAVMGARTGRLTDIFSGFGNPMMIDPELLANRLLPSPVGESFDDCRIPLTVVTTDFYARREVAFTAGPLRRAVAASIAIPGLFRPMEIDGRVLVDGGAVNPLPIDHVSGRADLIIAVDVTGGPVKPRHGLQPGPWEAMFGTLQILQASIVEQKVARHPVDVLVRPDVDLFKVLDFMQVGVILRLAKPAKEELKRKLGALLDGR